MTPSTTGTTDTPVTGERRPPRRGTADGDDRRPRREGFETILRRFFRDSQQNGILSEVKKRRFHDKPFSKTKRREIATRKANRRRVRRGY